MVEHFGMATIPSAYLDNLALPPRRCTQQRSAMVMDEKKLKDLQGFRLDESGRLKEAMSRTGFFTRFDYCDAASSELRSYVILDPNHQLLERAIRQMDDSWTIERFNPAKGRVEVQPSPYVNIKIDECGNITRVELSGNKDVLNIRMDTRQVVNTLTPTRAWLSI